VPKLYKLGSGAWKRLKQKTKKRVKEIAFDLITLYAKRRTQKGFSYDPDSYLQFELESSFIFEDTPDQITATEDIKRDMESERPMDRLICGDVGFGKTEVAIRAAFKAVDNGKQVAILVPTTILAFQHYRTFTERLKDMPVSVDYLNRFRTTKQRNDILERLGNGKLDIVIGTHQLVSKAVVFKDLGLLIIDEEQKFGVAVKDKLKTIKESVDTLTLTATPIPRTLQFSLMAARDLSVINTAPPNRYPIDTQVIRFSEEIIRDAIRYEISRGGQVFFVNNRIENIKEVAGLLQRLLPDAKIGIGHGQMEGRKLESLMLAFMNNEFDVLVSTTIIESGLDVPNANTIFINNANYFGLSDLHQMRGRVGRSNKKAFCYFITPPYSAMTSDARKRITAIEQFSELGSGFNIAMKDLEIRGAGDLLGGEQSGFINDIGFETYQKILLEAIDELKEKEFKELYAGTEHEKKSMKIN
jgi:transcription-repair coupling factor (superfamily II helicase)